MFLRSSGQRVPVVLLLLSTGCLSFPHYPPYDAARVVPVGQGAAAVRAAMGAPLEAWPAVPQTAEELAKTAPGCSSDSEEWSYTYSNCALKLVFDNDGKLCHIKQTPQKNPFDPPMPLCERRD